MSLTSTFTNVYCHNNCRFSPHSAPLKHTNVPEFEFTIVHRYFDFTKQYIMLGSTSCIFICNTLNNAIKLQIKYIIFD